MKTREIENLSVAKINEYIRNNEITILEVAQYSLDRYRKTENIVNAWAQVDEDRILNDVDFLESKLKEKAYHPEDLFWEYLWELKIVTIPNICIRAGVVGFIRIITPVMMLG